MIRVLSRVIAAIHHAAGRGPPPEQLHPWHVLHAERLVWEHAQEKHYSREIEALEKGATIPKDSPLARLSPGLRRGMLRSEGRLRNADIPAAAKYPVILPARHPAVLAFLRDLHEVNGHYGYRQMVTDSWERYWIVGGTVAAKKIVRNCVVCRRRDARPAQQRMADLPPDRVTRGGAAFANTGLDYFGPMTVKVGRRNEKRYGCLFTCLQTRAVHVEVAHSLDTQSFLMALERFITRRGLPEIIRSDNGRNFVAGNRELQDVIAGWNQERIHNALAPRNVTWLFNPPLASHMGGVWERQIRTVRRLFAGLTGDQRLTDEALHTLLVTAEGIVNNRPLTALSGDVGELGALTPNHLLMLRTADRPAPPPEGDAPHIRQRWRQVQYANDGDKYSTWPTSSGGDGPGNIYPCCAQGPSGKPRSPTSEWGTSSSSPMPTRPATPGRLPGWRRRCQAPTDLCAWPVCALPVECCCDPSLDSSCWKAWPNVDDPTIPVYRYAGERHPVYRYAVNDIPVYRYAGERHPVYRYAVNDIPVYRYAGERHPVYRYAVNDIPVYRYAGERHPGGRRR